MQDNESSPNGLPSSTLPPDDLSPWNDFATTEGQLPCFYVHSDDTLNQGHPTFECSPSLCHSLYPPVSVDSNVYQPGILYQQEDSTWIHPSFSLTESQCVTALYDAGSDHPLGPITSAHDHAQDSLPGSTSPEATSFHFEIDPTLQQHLPLPPTHTYASPLSYHMEQVGIQIQAPGEPSLADICTTDAFFSDEQGLLDHSATDFALAVYLDDIARSVDFLQEDGAVLKYERPLPHQSGRHEVEGASRTDVTLMQHHSTPRNDILANAFTESSYRPSPALRALLEYIRYSDFILLDAHEPLIADYFSICALAHINALADCPSIEFESLNHSLFTIFVDRSNYCCLLCGSHKSSLARALGCVRAHLGHRPFSCTGCQSCNVINGYTRFSTAALLRDHLNGQEKKAECIRCHTKLRRGGMKRHWNSMHKGEVFPFQDYPRYRRVGVTTQSSSSTCVTPDSIEDDHPLRSEAY